MTNRLEQALEQTGQVFIEMAQEIRKLKEEIAEMQVLVHKNESMKNEMLEVLKRWD